jgi:hypothetical protein
VSLLLGVALNEWIRRSNRIEAYAAAVFQKRFSVYEQLWEKVRGAKDVADAVLEDASLTPEQRHEVVSGVMLDIAKFCDDNGLYLNEEVTVHCCTVFMGVEDIVPELSKKKREQLLSGFNTKFNQAKEIIRAETGLKRMDRLFRALTKAKYSSSVIEYFRVVQKERAVQRRSRDNS